MFRRLFWRRARIAAAPSTYHKMLAVHIAATTRSAGRSWGPRNG
jgi:hypothetical protein